MRIRHALAMTVLIGLAGCGGHEEAAPPTPPARTTQVATASAATTQTAPSAPSPRTRPPTGNTTADAVIAAVGAGDVDTLATLMTFEMAPCVEIGATYVGSGAACPPGIMAGSMTEQFVADYSGETAGVLKSDARAQLSRWLTRSGGALHGAYRWTPPDSGLFAWLPSGVIIALDRGWFLLSSDNTRGTWVGFSALPSVPDFLARLGQAGTLEPLGTIVP